MKIFGKKIHLSIGRYLFRKHYQGIYDRVPNLRAIIDQAESLSASTGAQVSDYCILYDYIVTRKPKYVLECGTGKSTMVMAQAMLDAYDPTLLAETRIVSMEHDQEWYERQVKIFPEPFKPFVLIVHSPIMECSVGMIHGTAYSEIPDYPYEFVFVDGPQITLEDGKVVVANLDFPRLVDRSPRPVTAVVDGRVPAMAAFGLLFRLGKAVYYRRYGLGIIDRATREDLIFRDKPAMYKAFKRPMLKRKSIGRPFQ